MALLQIEPEASMSCQDLEGLLQPYADGEMDGPERAAIEAHLVGCPRCKAQVEAHGAYKRRMRQLTGEGVGAPASLRASLSRSLAAEPPPRRRALMRVGVAYPAILAAAAAAGIVLYVRLNPSESVPSDILDDAIAHHQRELPFEVQDEQMPRIQSWFKGKVDFAPSRIPSLRKANLLGARLSHVSDHQAAYVTFGTPSQRRVSLFVFDAPELKVRGGRRVRDRDVLIANQRGYNVALWKQNEIAYSLVSDLGEGDILELVAASAEAPAP